LLNLWPAGGFPLPSKARSRVKPGDTQGESGIFVPSGQESDCRRPPYFRRQTRLPRLGITPAARPGAHPWHSRAADSAKAVGWGANNYGPKMADKPVEAGYYLCRAPNLGTCGKKLGDPANPNAGLNNPIGAKYSGGTASGARRSRCDN